MKFIQEKRFRQLDVHQVKYRFIVKNDCVNLLIQWQPVIFGCVSLFTNDLFLIAFQIEKKEKKVYFP